MQKVPVLITGYVNPDLDAYACAAGYAELWQMRGREAVAGCYGAPLDEVSFVLSLIRAEQLPEWNVDDYDAYIVVDTSETYHLPEGLDPRLVEEVVDHHLYNDPALFPMAFMDIQPVGAAATLIVERFRSDGLVPTRETAALLYAGIVSNTLNFKAIITTERDRLAARWLWPLTQLPADFARMLFIEKSSFEGDKLIELLRRDMSGSVTDGRIFSIGQIEMVGAPELLLARGSELHHFMNSLREEQHSFVTFLSLSDIELGKTFFVTPHHYSQQVLGGSLGLRFSKGISEYPRLILRKEYVGQVKAYALSSGAFSQSALGQ